MSPTLSADNFDAFFAVAPWIIGAVIVIVAWLLVRGQEKPAVPIGRTYACARCGRRGAREHMVPQTHDGAVSWYCARCAGGH